MNKFDAEAVFKKQDTRDPETLTPVEGIEKTIKCHQYGKSEFIREKDSFELVSAQCYLIPEEILKENNIELGDYLDGQPIKIINKYTIPSGRIRKYEQVIYEVYTYKR